MKIIVRYWRGTTQYVGTATTYRGALRIASRNQNTYSPQYYDDKGTVLDDDGHGLAYRHPDQQGRTVYAV